VLQLFEEHLYTELVAQRVHHALALLPAAGAAARPHVLLATFSAEGHGLGLLMAQALLAAHGCRCTSLGVRLPVAQVVSAAEAFDADIVGLSFSASQNPAQVLRGLEQLRGELPRRVVIWAGGSCPAVVRRRLAGVQAIPDIAEVPAALAAWRTQARAAV
jgi:methylmalonyl-CoA mutase cobalamin-binding subunit